MNRVVEYSRRDWYRQGAVKNQVSFSHFKRSRKIETPIVDPIDLNCRSSRVSKIITPSQLKIWFQMMSCMYNIHNLAQKTVLKKPL